MVTMSVDKSGKVVSTPSPTGMSKEDIQLIQELSHTIGMSKSGQAALKKKIAELELQLSDNPIYKQITKLRRKVAMLKVKEKDTDVQLQGAYDRATRVGRRGKSVADMFDEFIPDQDPKAKKGLKR